MATNESLILEQPKGTPRRMKTYFNIANSLLDSDGNYWNDRLVDLCNYGDTRSVVELVNKVKRAHDEFSLDRCHSKTGETCLLAAVKNKHYECVEVLLQLGVDPTVCNSSGESVIDFCISDDHLRSLIMTADSRLPLTSLAALNFSAWVGNPDLFSKYMNLCDVHVEDLETTQNANGNTLILIAIKDIADLTNLLKNSNFELSFKPEEIVAKLLKSGVSVNTPNSHHQTSLHFLSQYPCEATLNIMQQIFDTGLSDVNIRDDDNNQPLHYACLFGNEEAAFLLVNHGSEINAKGQDGQTPLHLSAISGSIEIIRLLLSVGADVTLIDDRGKTACDIAEDLEVRTSLKEAWAEVTTHRRSSNFDVESSLERDAESRLAYSSGNMSKEMWEEANQLRPIQSLPVLPSISPVSSIHSDKSDENHPAKHITQSENEKFLEKTNSSPSSPRVASRKTNRGSVKPRLRRWRSISAGVPNPGLRLPPLQWAVFEIGISSNRKVTIGHSNETSDESESTISEVSRTAPNSARKPVLKTLQTTMPTRVSLTELIILGSKAPQVGSEVSAGNIAGRSSSTNKQENCGTICKPISSQPNSRSLSTPAKSQTPQPSRRITRSNSQEKKPAKAAPIEPRRLSLSNERVVTLRQAPPKDIAPLYPNAGANQNKQPNLIEKVMQPSVTIEPIFADMIFPDSSEDDRSSVASRESSKSTKSSKKSKKPPKKANKKVVKKVNKSPPKKAKPAVKEEKEMKFEREPVAVSHTFPPPLDDTPQEDENSLRDLSEIIQLSTVLEEDEMLASIRSSLASRKTPIIPSKSFESDDNKSADTLTPEEESFEEMHREMEKMSQEILSLTGTLPHQQPLVDDDDDYSNNFDYEDEYQSREVKSPISHRAVSRASSKNPMIFQEDQSLPDDEASNHDTGDLNEEHEVPGGDGHSERSMSRSSFESQPDMQQSIKWRKGNEIGHGAYGKVFLALTSLGGWMAVKQIDTSRYSRDTVEKEYERIDEEINILRTLKHSSIVEFYGTSFEGDVVNIFMEFIAGGSIASILRRFGSLEEPVFRRYTKQLLKTITYLHANGIVHRDIKGANVMVTGEGQIKLIDFGCARRLVESAEFGTSSGSDTMSQTGHQLKSAKGTPYWMAPEVICETGHGRKSDIWSLGCTVFEMATRRPPWADLEPTAAMFAIASGRNAMPQLPSPPFSSEASSFVAACFNRQPVTRPTAAELLEHKWFITSARRRTPGGRHKQGSQSATSNSHIV